MANENERGDLPESVLRHWQSKSVTLADIPPLSCVGDCLPPTKQATFQRTPAQLGSQPANFLMIAP